MWSCRTLGECRSEERRGVPVEEDGEQQQSGSRFLSAVVLGRLLSVTAMEASPTAILCLQIARFRDSSRRWC